MTVYSLDVLLSWFGPSLLFHVQFFLSCIQISQEAGEVLWYSHLFQNFPQFIVIHTVKGFGIVNKTEVDVFLDLSCFFKDPVYVGNLISGSSAFSKSSLNIWNFTVHVLLRPGLENLDHYFASMGDECNCAVVWTFFGIAFLCDWNENWPFPILLPLLSFPHLLAYSVQFSRSVVSDPLQPHEPQHTRPPCPSPTAGVHPNSCPLSHWCHPTISSSVVPFSCPQSFPTSGSFQMSQLFLSDGQRIGVSASTSVLPVNTQDWSPLGWTISAVLSQNNLLGFEIAQLELYPPLALFSVMLPKAHLTSHSGCLALGEWSHHYFYLGDEDFFE